jgi:tetratricopeptide (TPR) repeat protein
MNNVAQAIPIIEKAVNELTTLGNEREQAVARFTQGDLHLYVGNLDEAEIHLSTALVYFRTYPQESFYLVNTLSSLGRVAHAKNDLENAYHFIEESSKLSKEEGDLSTFTWNQTVLGDIAYTQNNLTLARKNYEASLENYRTLNRSINMSYLYEVLGSLAYWRGELDLATKLLEECFKQYILANSDDGTAFSFGYYASILQAQKNTEGAKHWLKYAASPISKIDNIYRSVYAVKLADYAQAIGDSTSATVLYLYALRLTSDPTTVLFPPDRQHAQAKLESIRRSLDEAEFEALSKQAETLQIEEAVRLIFPT